MTRSIPRTVVTRFAPSPTGYLHIGGARTALFNWLYARGRGGRFLLRIEDTDRERSTPEATAAILRGLEWLGLDWDGEPVSQFARAARHAEVARAMMAAGTAYPCYSTPEEIAAWREEHPRQPFASPWRDADPASRPDTAHSIRLRAPREGETVIRDAVQGVVTIANAELDDMILLRSGGTPTYMLAVVVDDHDMGVTHVIRGDDHLVNAARQQVIYAAMGWEVPVWAHIPLIHGPDGKKLSKRHGATGLEEYQAMGYPAAAMRNYLTRLGWAHGDMEIFTSDEAMAVFDLSGIGRAPARLDFRKLANVSGHHLAMADAGEVLAEFEGFLAASGHPALSDAQRDLVAAAMPFLKERSKTFVELLENARFILTSRPIAPDAKAREALAGPAPAWLAKLTKRLPDVSWTREGLEATLNAEAAENGTGFGKLAAPLRAALSGRAVAPSVFDMMLVLGRQESIARLADAAGSAEGAGPPDEGAIDPR